VFLGTAEGRAAYTATIGTPPPEEASGVAVEVEPIERATSDFDVFNWESR
jgi:hypothetical protein